MPYPKINSNIIRAMASQITGNLSTCSTALLVLCDGSLPVTSVTNENVQWCWKRFHVMTLSWDVYETRGRLKIKVPSHHYRDSHYKDNLYTWKDALLYWDEPSCHRWQEVLVAKTYSISFAVEHDAKEEVSKYEGYHYFPICKPGGHCTKTT